ncbi:hypothetical protein G6R40_02840 [Chryseobacterium sp. POL2]|uniref:hypothetical protein n=1 Tax=Chryseobacterium sp. POL2 TaxID=2713414 RepID=UPI0013E1197D|nr:hypothetical protein [Chryseobacterium sp. POL2]QIG88668.1 hypothetical protein G6R40_02840 [Chryseobacterium sp. POL2]
MKKNYFLTMLALLFLFSCTREYLMESNDTIQVHSNSRVDKVSFEEMENFIQKNAKNTLPDYLKPNNLNKNTEQYITAIDTADIIKVVHNDVTSFTLKVNTLGDKDFTFSNLIINVHNGNIEEYIYHYIPDAQWLKNYIASKKGDYQGILKITDINGNNKTENHAKNSTTCMVEMHVPCFGAGCPCSDYNGVTYYIMATCTTGGGGGSSGGSSGGNTGGPPSGGGGGGTVPNVPTTEQINNFIAFLSPSTHAYITENIGALTDITNYFAQNGLAPKHQGFITSVLEYVTKKDIAWFNFSPIFASATSYKNQNPDSWTKISTIQDFAFDFMLQNPNFTWVQFQNEFITDIPSGFLQQIVLQNPATVLNYQSLNSPDFKMRKVDQLKYPKFTNAVINIANYVNSNMKVMQTLTQFTGLNEQQILDKLKFGQGPLIQIVDLPGAYGYHNPFTNTVKIDVNYVKKLENSVGADAEIMKLFLSITLLHEFVHWTDGLFFNYTQESGEEWEIATYGVVVNMGNINLIKQ